jgi:hypothetical protein
MPLTRPRSGDIRRRGDRWRLTAKPVAHLSRRRSRVRVPSLPSRKALETASFADLRIGVLPAARPSSCRVRGRMPSGEPLRVEEHSPSGEAPWVPLSSRDVPTSRAAETCDQHHSSHSRTRFRTRQPDPSAAVEPEKVTRRRQPVTVASEKPGRSPECGRANSPREPPSSTASAGDFPRQRPRREPCPADEAHQGSERLGGGCAEKMQARDR